MPYDRRPRQLEEDPEVVAEREYNRIHGIKEDIIKVEEKCVEDMATQLEAAGLDGARPVPISPAADSGNGSGNASTASSLKQFGSFKENKASRKKRCRGVSGSSIKKDGGRFDMGMDDYGDDEIDVLSEDEHVYNGYAGDLHDDVYDEGLKIADFHEALCNAVGTSDVHDLTPLVTILLDCMTDTDRVRLMCGAVYQLIEEESERRKGPRLLIDACGEYRLCVVLARLIHQLFDEVDTFDAAYEFVSSADSISAFVDCIIKAAREFNIYNTAELRGETQACPDEAVEDVIDSIVNGEFNRDRYADSCAHLELFHVEIVKRVITYAVCEMDIGLIRRVEQSLLDFALYSGAKFDCVYRLSLARLLSQANQLFGDLPAWPITLRLFVAELADSDSLWSGYSGPGRNWDRIPSSQVSLKLDPDSSKLLVVHNPPKNNITLLQQ